MDSVIDDKPTFKLKNGVTSPKKSKKKKKHNKQKQQKNKHVATNWGVKTWLGTH